MNLKRFTKSFVIVIAFAVAVGAAYMVLAAEPPITSATVLTTPPAPSYFVPMASTETAPSNLEWKNVLQNYRNIGLNGVDTRLNNLKSKKSKYAASKFSDSQKTTFNAIIDPAITSLTQLRVRIASSSDLQEIISLSQSAFTTNRINSVVMPQVYGLDGLFSQQNHVTTLQAYFTKVQTKINAAKAEGKDVIRWQGALDNAKTIVESVNNRIVADITRLKNASVSDTPSTTKQLFDSVAVNIKENSQDFYDVVYTLRSAKVAK